MNTLLMPDDLTIIFPEELVLPAGGTARRVTLDNHNIDFHAGNETVALVFAQEPDENAQHAEGAANLETLSEAGYSILHFSPKKPDWYQHPALHQWFASPPVENFLRGFPNAIFIGASMGGFAAITFSRLRPGALVIAHHPQSTLEKTLVPKETRFPAGRAQNWSGPFADAAAAAPLARRIYITYDPFFAPDKRHVDRLPGQNIVHLKLPFLGHQSHLALDQLKITAKTTTMMLAETMTVYEFARMTRERRKLPQYYHNAAQRVRKRKHLDALLFDAARRDFTDPIMYKDTVLRMFERRMGRKGLEHYYGRLSLSFQLPSHTQGIMRAQAGIAEFRNDPGPFEPKLRRERNARMAKLAQAIDYNSTNVRELIDSAKFMRALQQWRKVEPLVQAAVKLDPKQTGAKHMIIEAQKQIAKTDVVPTTGQKIRKFFADLW